MGKSVHAWYYLPMEPRLVRGELVYRVGGNVGEKLVLCEHRRTSELPAVARTRGNQPAVRALLHELVLTDTLKKSLPRRDVRNGHWPGEYTPLFAERDRY